MSAKLTLKELATLTSSTLIGSETHLIEDIADLEQADSRCASFLANKRYSALMQKSKAGVVFISKDTPLIEGRNFLIHDNPSYAFQQTIEYFHKDKIKKSYFEGIHETSVISKSAKIGKEVTIAPFVVIEEGVVIGNKCHIGPNVYIGPNSTIGEECTLFANVTIRENIHIGNRVIIQPGAIIGSCGFGYSTDEKGIHTKLEQIGSVLIEDDVEIGANTTIDRGRFAETIIRKGSKIDNLVQIAHNVEIGPYNLIVAQCGIAGSSKTGRNVVMAGQAALVGHLKIADGTIIAARGAASKSVEIPGGKFAGAPMMPLAEHNKQSVYLRNIEKYVKKLEALEEEIASLKKLIPFKS